MQRRRIAMMTLRRGDWGRVRPLLDGAVPRRVHQPNEDLTEVLLRWRAAFRLPATRTARRFFSMQLP
jgi:hypothetical protein